MKKFLSSLLLLGVFFLISTSANACEKSDCSCKKQIKCSCEKQCDCGCQEGEKCTCEKCKANKKTCKKHSEKCTCEKCKAHKTCKKQSEKCTCEKCQTSKICKTCDCENGCTERRILKFFKKKCKCNN